MLDKFRFKVNALWLNKRSMVVGELSKLSPGLGTSMVMIIRLFQAPGINVEQC